MITSKYLEFAKEYGLYVGLVVCGIGLMIGGVLMTSAQTKSEHNPEFISGPEPIDAIAVVAEVVVDVAGAVMIPGVYRLPSGSRVGEAVVTAGGFSPEADADYVARQINLADVLRDGMKIYVPARGAEIAKSDPISLGVVSINSATKGELEELWGVGEARATAIIENRPYTLVEELVSKAKLPQAVLDNNQGKIRL